MSRGGNERANFTGMRDEIGCKRMREREEPKERREGFRVGFLVVVTSGPRNSFKRYGKAKTETWNRKIIT